MTLTKENPGYQRTDEKYYENAARCLESNLEAGRISQSDYDLIKKFARRIRIAVGACHYSIMVSQLVTARRYFAKDYADTDDDDFLDAMAAIQSAVHTEHPVSKKAPQLKAWQNYKGKPLAHNTKVDLMKMSKRFFVFLADNQLTKVTSGTLRSIKIPTKSRVNKTEDDVLTPDEINRMIATTGNPQYRAYIAVLYETGARSVELSNLKWRDLDMQGWGISVRLTDTKTSKYRTVPIISYAKYVYEWMNSYPGGCPSPDSFVFINRSGEPIRYQAVSVAVKKIAKTAGITRKVTLHRFRHSRITHVLRAGMNESIVKKSFWGNMETGMITTYGHLTSKDVRDEHLRMAGIQVSETETVTEIKPLTCPTCHQIWPPGTMFCTCGTPLTAESKKQKADGERDMAEYFSSLPADKQLLITGIMKEILNGLNDKGVI